ncbi:hypothetical protein CCHR01_15967 [Colletotrichum chrysophilum]|uniref:Cyanovirin-N domain-containing protein n=1 Tax=Colletotrichum chrysophilum TaxID=1836956 RepID=A0AAD9A5D4_9PEZI|nr:hypothetical protein CCHR01_15967 [Colletotrichum chrysophilum]
MKIHSVAFLLSSVVTVVQSQNVKYCNYGTSDSALECSNCIPLLNVQEDSSLKQGFPVRRSCGGEGIQCSVKNDAGNNLYGRASCVGSSKHSF